MTVHAKARGYLSASDNRKRIDTLNIGEIFTIGGFSFRNENFLPPTRYKKTGGIAAASSNQETERPRFFPDLERARRAREKAKEDEESRRRRSKNGNRGMIQEELL